MPTTPTNVPISSLPAAGAVTSGNLVALVQGGTTVKGTVAALATGLPEATTSVSGLMPATDKAKLNAATNTSTASTIVQRDASSNFSANVITAATVTGLTTPLGSTDAANKAYVDAAAAGLNIKSPARVATTGSNITLSGGAPNTLDGVTLAANDRILVKDQTNKTQNGIYYVDTLGTGSNGTWSRTTDADTGAELVAGTYIYVSAGTQNASSSWVQSTQGTIVIGTSNIVWTLYSQVTTIAASNITGQIVSAQIADAAVNTAKFAAGITPVEIVATLPTAGNFEGRQAFLTTNGKLYRYTSGAWTTTVATVDLTGQITNGQLTDGAVSIAKFASGITPVEIVGSLPSTGNFEGRQAMLTTDGKVYRYTSSAWTAAVATVDLTGTISEIQIANSAISEAKVATGAITTTKITDSAITTAKLVASAVTADKIVSSAITSDKIAANAITAGKIATNAVTAGTIAANAVTAGTIAANAITTGTIAAGAITATEIASNAIVAGKIAAGAVTAGTLAAGVVTANEIASNAIVAGKIAANAVTAGTIAAAAVSATEIAAGAITSSKIYAGAVTSDKITVGNLAAINADLGSITAGTISVNASISLGSGTGAVSISNSGMVIGGRINFQGDGTNPWVRVTGTGTYTGSRIEMNGNSGFLPPFFTATGSGGTTTITELAVLSPSHIVNGGNIRKATADTWAPSLFDGNNNLEFRWSDDNKLQVRIDGTTILTISAS